MARKKILVDSGFLFALYAVNNVNHSSAKSVSETLIADFLVPEVVLTETAFLFNRLGGVPAVTSFLQDFVQSRPLLQNLTASDLTRVREIMAAYPEARLDFVDCCIMALSERLDVREVATFDRRDFPIFRPRHCDALTLLP
jgi:predicted nucleic acid-binding protein